MQLRFADVASVQAYVDRVLATPIVGREFPEAGPIEIRGSRSRTRARYLPDVRVIELPAELWAGRESVVLHETAHHLACSRGIPPERSSGRWHGREFRDAMDVIVTEMLGDAAALLLRSGYAEAGVAGAQRAERRGQGRG